MSVKADLNELISGYGETAQQYLDYGISVVHDNDSESPREWDNLGTIVVWHRDYNLSDTKADSYTDFHSLIHELSGLYLDEYAEYLDDSQICKCITTANRKAVILPIYMYDHSGITINTSGFSCPWDSGLVGVIFVTNEQIRKEYNVKRVSKKLREKVATYLQSEIATYDDYLTGNVYGYSIEKDGEHVDSCWGFIGDIEKSGLMYELVSAIEYDIEETRKQKQSKTKQYIKSKVPLEYRAV